MIRSIVTTLVATTLFLSVGCSSSSKKAKEGEDLGPITSEAMNFDSNGSDSGKIDGLQTVNFAYDQASLDEAAKGTLQSNAEWMKKNNNVTMQIEGHCDSRGSVEYNLALGERRAKTVKNYLITLGIDGNRMKIISYGKEKPLVEGDTDDAYSKNRRANFIPLPN